MVGVQFAEVPTRHIAPAGYLRRPDSFPSAIRITPRVEGSHSNPRQAWGVTARLTLIRCYRFEDGFVVWRGMVRTSSR